MKLLTLLLLTIVGPALTAQASCPCSSCTCEKPYPRTVAEETPAPEADAHPLRGMVEGVITERQSLLVKHEAIPGVMMAMTMVLKVTPEVLTIAQTGNGLTGLLYRDDQGDWALRDVKLSSPPPAPTS